MTAAGPPVVGPDVLVLNSRRGPRQVSRSEKLAALGVCLLLFLEHLAFGGVWRPIALGFAALQGVMLVALVIMAPWAAQAIARSAALTGPALLFAAVILVALWSLTPYAPGGPHPAWTYVSAAPASTIDRSAVLIALIQLSALACLVLIGWVLGVNEARARFTLLAICAAATAYAIWSFVAHLVDPGQIFGVVPNPQPGRLLGSFRSANTAGALFGVGLVLITSELVQALRRWRTGPDPSVERLIPAIAPAAIGVAFCAVCLILTASRGAMAATGVALGLFIAWEAIARRWKLLGRAGAGLLLAFLAAGGLLVLGGSPFFARLLDFTRDSALRQELMLVHWRAFLASPWMGYGLGSFDAINKLSMTDQNYSFLWNVHATHNVYLQWLEEGGLIGAAPMFACLGWLLLTTAAAGRHRSRMETALRGLTMASVVLLVHGATDFALQEPSISSMWACLLGLGAGLATTAGRR